MRGRLIDGYFPDWRRVVPKPQKNKTPFCPKEIKALLPELAVISKIGLREKTTLVISKGIARNTDVSMGIKKQWPVKITWDMEVGFNAKFLSELCGGLMEYKDPASPFKVTDRRGTAKLMGIVMPMRV